MSELPRPGALIAGRYRIESVLGQGGMGAVFAASDTMTGRAVALKLLAPSAAESADAVLRFIAEARATAKIDHPNVVTVIDVGREGQSPFLVMERLRGESLKQRIARGPLSVNEALDVLIPACRGVAEAHVEGVIHRDLKPDNIFLCESHDGRPLPKVVDFGVAKLRQGQMASLTKSGVVIGTPAYISPEQIGTPREADPRFDVYSMGVVLYEALTGRLPYDADELVVLIRMIAEGRAAPIRSLAPEVPAALEAIVRRAMHVDREQRYATMHELIHALEGIRTPAPHRETRRAEISTRPGPRPPSVRPGPSSTRPPPRPSRAPFIVLGSLFAVAIAVLGVFGVALAWKERGSNAMTGAPAAIDLTFGGACDPRFDDEITVEPVPGGGVRVRSGSADRPSGSLVFTGGMGAPLGEGIPMERAEYEMGLGFHVVDGTSQPWVDTPPEVDGTITLSEWDLRRGRIDVRLDDVRLRHTEGGDPCTVDGRLRTFGYSSAH